MNEQDTTQIPEGLTYQTRKELAADLLRCIDPTDEWGTIEDYDSLVNTLNQVMSRAARDMRGAGSRGLLQAARVKATAEMAEDLRYECLM